MQCLVLALDSPLSSFGTDVIDNRGPVRNFPGRSLLCGLFGNALGYERYDADLLDELQRRLVHVSAVVRKGRRIVDYQTARLFEKECGWTTRGKPEGRATSPSFNWDERYEAERGVRKKSLTHQRYRVLDADARTLVSLSLDKSRSGFEESPDVSHLATALDYPERPLFIGRKPNLPACRLLVGIEEAASAAEALTRHLGEAVGVPVEGHPASFGLNELRVDQQPPDRLIIAGDYQVVGLRWISLSDERRHQSGVHSGTRLVMQGTIGGGKSANAILERHIDTEGTADGI